MPVTADDIAALIRTGVENADVQIIDLAGDGDHFKAIVTCAGFAGKSRVQQHQMVYAALGDIFKGRLHALALETKISQPL